MSRYAGPYQPGAVQIIIGAPVGPLGVAVVIPNLPAGATFPILVTGRSADSFSSATQTTDTNSMVAGADGEVVHVLSYDPTGSITISVMQSSITNLVFSAAHTAMSNRIAPLAFTFPVTVKDPLAQGDLVTGTNCVIQRAPDHTRGASEGNNAWTFLAADLRILHGARFF